MASFDVAAARAQFPALQQEQVFMDNAGKWHLGRKASKLETLR